MNNSQKLREEAKRIEEWPAYSGADPDDLRAAAAEIEGLRSALQSIASKCPATCEMTLAHEMAEEAEAALALTSKPQGGG